MSSLISTLVFFRKLLNDLVNVCGSPDLIAVRPEAIYQKAVTHLQEMNALLHGLADLPENNKDGYYPLDIFFQSEIVVLRETIQRVQSDVGFLIKVARGEIPSTPESEEQVISISKLQV